MLYLYYLLENFSYAVVLQNFSKVSPKYAKKIQLDFTWATSPSKINKI